MTAMKILKEATSIIANAIGILSALSVILLASDHSSLAIYVCFFIILLSLAFQHSELAKRFKKKHVYTISIICITGTVLLAFWVLPNRGFQKDWYIKTRRPVHVFVKSASIAEDLIRIDFPFNENYEQQTIAFIKTDTSNLIRNIYVEGQSKTISSLLATHRGSFNPIVGDTLRSGLFFLNIPNPWGTYQLQSDCSETDTLTLTLRYEK